MLFFNICICKNIFLCEREHFNKCSRFFYFQEENHAKNEQSSRQIVMCHLMAIMRIDIEKAKRIVVEMEEFGLIQFDDMGNVGLLVLEGQS